MDRLQKKSLWYGPANFDNGIFENVQNSRQCQKTSSWKPQEMEREWNAGRQHQEEVKIQRGMFQGDSHSQLQFVLTMMPLNEFGSEQGATKYKPPYVQGWYQGICKRKMKKNLRLIHEIKNIYGRIIIIEFDIKKCIMKREPKDETEVPNQEQKSSTRT